MVTRSQYSFCVPIPKKQWTKNLSKYFLVIFRNSTGFYFCWCFFNVPPSPLKKTCKLQSPKMALRSVPKKSNTFPRFLGSSCAATCCSVHSAGNCRPPLGVFFSENTTHFPDFHQPCLEKTWCFHTPREPTKPGRLHGLPGVTFLDGVKQQKNPNWKDRVSFNGPCYRLLGTFQTLWYFLCHEKKNVKELSVEYWLFKKGIPIEMVYFISPNNCVV